MSKTIEWHQGDEWGTHGGNLCQRRGEQGRTVRADGTIRAWFKCWVAPSSTTGWTANAEAAARIRARYSSVRQLAMDVRYAASVAQELENAGTPT